MRSVKTPATDSRSMLERVRGRAGDQSGVAIPTALAVLVLAFGFAVVALVATTSSQNGSNRDEDRKQAVAVANAGIDQALYRLNKIQIANGRCHTPSGSGTLISGGMPQSDGWCAPVSGSVGGETYTYRIKPPAAANVNGQDRREIVVVSVGSADQQSRRIAVRATAATGTNIFGDYGAIGREDVTVDGNAEVHVDTGSNENVGTQGSALICDNIRHGPGHSFTGAQCPGYSVEEGEQPLPPPNLSGVYSSNSNGRLFSQDPKTGNATWDASAKRLTLQGNASVTLGGTNYLLCQLDMSGSSALIQAQGARVTLWFDSPENCGLSSGQPQVKMSGTSKILSTSYNPEAGIYDMMAIHMLGSNSGSSTAEFGGNASIDQEFILYAPNTHVEIYGNSRYVGPIAGQSLYLHGNPRLESASGLPGPSVDVVAVYQPDRFVECTGATGSPPDASC